MDTRTDASGRPARPLAPGPPTAGCRQPAGAVVAAAVGAVLAAAFLALYLWAVRSEDGQSADIDLLVTLQSLNPALGPAATVLRPGLVVGGALACVALGVLALARRRWRSLCAAVLVVALSVGGTWALKELVLERPYLGAYGYTVNTFPSGHVSATLALVAAAALLSPAWRTPASRWLFRLALLAVAVAACVSSLLEHVHRPSDVVGSVLLVGSVTALVVAAVRPPPAPRPPTPA
ncbi:phosphatase PAP2 family protein [Sanguibacter suarezii]|uniref:phosphatase PAP2 family protein n=1 Tax=Sanguibacter suarezii TaxID=60921 RepID=UPI000B2E8DE3|nr:phosphatase PAP2 family protein [Sanguibacter suarezii]